MGSNCACYRSTPDSDLLNLRHSLKDPTAYPYSCSNMNKSISHLVDLVYQQKQTDLSTINLSYKEINEENTSFLSVVLPYYYHLHKLILNSAFTGNEVWEILADPLKDLTNLKELELSFNSIGTEGAKRVAEALDSMYSLERLLIQNASLGDEGIKYIATGLYGLKALQVLHLGENMIGDLGAASLGNTLASLSSLAVLDLEKNEIGIDGTRSIAAGIKGLLGLKTLKLSENNIQSEGLLPLAQAFPSSLSELYLDTNSITKSGIMCLAKELPRLTMLKIFSLNHNYIEDEGAKILMVSLQHVELNILGLVDCGVLRGRSSFTSAQPTADILF
ncbi:unnamed protein product [Blepharisma stoltei]|uniref:Uncharacterized protein n=1 Tax=Blepharisma stoltei TaxID=1481888 RepID=A0AAU9KA27_9CILI|nr:unnamed protein product [Blepharisma stoltei]